MICEIDIGNLATRTGDVKRTLDRLVSRKAVLVVEPAERNPGLTLAARSGSFSDRHYDEWKFHTYVNGIRASYYERWVPTDSTRRRYFLERGYLHVFKRSGNGRDAAENQLLALHCDPNEPERGAHSKYQRGPHIHVSAAGSPLKDAHIALNFSHLGEILSSIDQLSRAWTNAVTLVAEQVLDLYR